MRLIKKGIFDQQGYQNISKGTEFFFLHSIYFEKSLVCDQIFRDLESQKSHVTLNDINAIILCFMLIRTFVFWDGSPTLKS